MKKEKALFGCAMRSITSLAARALIILPPLRATMSATSNPRAPNKKVRDILLALAWGLSCHTLFLLAVISMISGMWFGMSRSLGNMSTPWNWIANLALLLQFPIVHSFMLTKFGRRLLERLAPFGAGKTLSSTTYVIIASLQLVLLFSLWTPSGIIWWQAEGVLRYGFGVLYTISWLLLIKASWDAGAEVQSGVLGWASLMRGVRPHYPPMPTDGLFRYVRQPIYVCFALTTWTVPTWTPDQLLLAIVFTAYCLIGPLAKEKRFKTMFDADWQVYRKQTPYCVPNISSSFTKSRKS